MPKSQSLQATSDLCPDRPTAASRVHLLMCTNALYFQHLGVCLTSLLINNPSLFFDIVVVRRTGEELDEDKLRRTLARFLNYSLSFRVFTFPADPLLPLNPDAHYTLDNWTRLWIENFFPGDIDRVLYLDSDIVVVGSVAALWCADLDGALLGAIEIPGSLQGVAQLGMCAEDGYFNSGVLLIDLKQWRESHALNTVLQYVEAYAERLIDLDQDALNACFHNRTKRLGYRWNATWSFYREPVSIPLPASEIARVRQEARIIHFNGNSKPWNYLCDHPRKAEYDKYLRMTEWRDFVPEDRTAVNWLRKRISAILPEKAKTLLKHAVRLMISPAVRLMISPAVRLMISKASPAKV